MKRTLAGFLLVLTGGFFLGFRILHGSTDKNGRVGLPSSKLLLGPLPGNPQRTNSFPTATALSPDGKYLALLNDGYGTFDSDYSQSIAVLDIAKNELTDFPDKRLERRARQSFFYGLAFSNNGKELYASMSSMSDPSGKSSGSTGSGVAVYKFSKGKVETAGFIRFPASNRPAQPKAMPDDPDEEPSKGPGFTVPYPSGICAFRQNGKEMLLVADNLSDSAEIVDVKSKKVTKTVDLAVYSAVPGSYPFAAKTTKDGSTGYVSLWNASRVAEIDLTQGSVRHMFELHLPSNLEAAGSHPTALLLSPDEKRLYVALANTDEVAVINRDSREVSYLNTKLPDQQYGGNFPIALALTPDGQRLFVANASSDAIAVFDSPESNSKPRGFIPTEWYPTALAVHDGELFIATGKGQSTGPNKGLTGKVNGKERTSYIASLLHGSIARVKLNDVDARLPDWTQEVEASNLMRGNADQIAFTGGGNPIKHVIYIIKENRSYDQVLGDLGVGDGDPSLTMFGEDVSPNEHKLARQFGVLDNFYDSGEVSGDGHVWSNAAISSDYTEQTWEIGYRGKERTYDYEGVVNERYPIREHIPDVNEPATGYLWGNFARHGITYRHYGEFISTKFCSQKQTEEMPQTGTPLQQGGACTRNSIKFGEPLPDYLGQPHGSPSPWPWAIPMVQQNIATKPELEGHFDPRYPDFNLNFPDQLRADEFLNEFEQFVSKRSAGQDTMPQFILLRLPDDHTSGTRPGIATPPAAVADNDLAVGRVVEAVSHSAYWQDTAIFILEDDAQNGADHVDAHRSIAWAISRFSPHGPQGKPFVDHTFYTTVNMVHTMEALLGAPPMNNNDARAAVMAAMFSGEGDQPPYSADTRNRDNRLIYKMNPPKGADAKKSAELDFSHADAADAGVLNAILWRNRMGDRPIPHTPGAEFK
ncbi:MAG TPA: bifunctional YncE family protein/alkaline phosphatase family protein [Terriglobales bacterium]|nr:bifunctional YncE family protein/alkaline phosphatase family protein [Terriglobales bacterium]